MVNISKKHWDSLFQTEFFVESNNSFADLVIEDNTQKTELQIFRHEFFEQGDFNDIMDKVIRIAKKNGMHSVWFSDVSTTTKKWAEEYGFTINETIYGINNFIAAFKFERTIL